MKNRFEEHILEVLEIFPDSRIREALSYSLVAPGKRVRPLLMLSLIEDFGKSYFNGLDCAVALEMIHCYSLVHDDLPAMDNDDLRRGRLTNHKQFDEATAILAGDALLTNAFEVVTSSNIKDDKKVKIIRILSHNAGIGGMILGQALDMQYEQRQDVSLAALIEMYVLKTGRLISSALEIACIISEREDCLDLVREIGRDIGIAFQIQDDVLDATKSSSQIGKSASDLENNKTTAVKILGLDEANRYVDELFTSIFDKIGQLNLFGNEFRLLIETMINREI